jgi:hypothetical protein
MRVCASSPDIRVSHSQIERFITRNTREAAAFVCINGNGLCPESEDKNKKPPLSGGCWNIFWARVIYAGQKLKRARVIARKANTQF